MPESIKGWGLYRRKHILTDNFFEGISMHQSYNIYFTGQVCSEKKKCSSILFHEKKRIDHTNTKILFLEVIKKSSLRYWHHQDGWVFDWQHICWCVFQVGIPMGINCVSFLADLLLYSYEINFMQGVLKKNKTNHAHCIPLYSCPFIE